MANNAYTWIEESLETIHRANWYRKEQTIEGRAGATVKVEGRELLNFASNDYLGLAGDERLIQAAINAAKEFGTGATGSRLITGHRELHTTLEKAIATLKQTEDALVFSSGYLANIGTIAACVGKRDLILSDRYNHSSLKNGAILSGAKVIEYAHNDIEDLKQKLEENRARYRRCLIITDSVFSMDGDLCQLPQLLDLAEKFNAMLLVDEAHATGVLGATGAGCVEHFGCTGKELIQVGTLSKALGSLGGYVAGKAALIDFLRNRSQSWIYTTGLTPADTAAAIEAIAIIKKEPERRAQLWENIIGLKNLLWQAGIIEKNSHLFQASWESAIICLPLKDAQTVLAAGENLKEAGILAAAVRPPTVPTSRIRITVMATHQLNHIKKLVEALKAIAWKFQS
ncbi:MAG: 8-amino-7-oxononanoate synthase [Oscillatoriaceae bacterium SKW80]|nr:8-amino-7-oxononanoate synthase [Oscillatoriaceae bacterium SKYG93]MCX8120661.1 8-amino-7-oxononanoate synthase [Oscillatoriaceae bacterium SKW80]MDW8453801.1 8-amino-7-oxononanoate synthase [Oscillatoriaceae cyanobacterium SKYGB_i_bin93]HIK27031.1 8-amino-7-oxononanoate synthase [Oscillatoriaceae cyanobacterium M7585_C2015_266]